MPKNALPRVVNVDLPQPLSRMACAIATEAGTRHSRWPSCASGATDRMNADWLDVSITAAARAGPASTAPAIAAVEPSTAAAVTTTIPLLKPESKFI
ncbi:hypothetical protein [Granulicoccus sp. GXG6511]|uniref:hypothetical protein n=1 Tax=Granulicoccus sp. GXG6511 TaxID=3381351 RepID=UPI003D7D798F